MTRSARFTMHARPPASLLMLQAWLTAILAVFFCLPSAWAQEMDQDGDGLGDPWDNCAEVANPDQTDSDADGFGNACDADYDNDQAVTAADFGTFLNAFGGPGTITDHDGDGFTAASDFGLFLRFFGGVPGPGAIAPDGGANGTLMQGWIDEAQVMHLAEPLRKSGYGEYLLQLLSRGQDA